jgi:hypothetical protein
VAIQALEIGNEIMARANAAAKWTELTLEERRERRQLRREKQREDNIGRAAKMHVARLRMEAVIRKGRPIWNDRSMSDARAGVTGNGGIRFMLACRSRTGSRTT